VNNGLTERVYQLSAHLGRSHEVTVLFPRELAREAGAEGRVPEDRPFERVGLRSRAVDALEPVLPNFSPLRGAYQFHPWLYPSLRAHFSGTEGAPDAVLVEFPYLVPVVAAALRGFDVPLVLSEHNVEYTFAKRVGIPLWRALAWYERLVCERVDAVVTVSEADRTELAAHTADGTDFAVAPNGVDVDRYRPEASDRDALPETVGDPVIVYHGNLANAHNSEAVSALLDQVFPAVRAEVPDATLLLVGPNPPETDQPGVVATGLVEDLPAYLAAADVAAAPLFSGSGTNLKVLEYLASGVPTVTTPVGAEGLPLAHGEHALVVDDAPAVADAVATLVADEGLHGRLSEQGRDLVERQFSWSTTLRPYEHLLARL
jgi:glycosyltransferase involved in cell wall biosynthesis